MLMEHSSPNNCVAVSSITDNVVKREKRKFGFLSLSFFSDARFNMYHIAYCINRYFVILFFCSRRYNLAVYKE